jgi:hypothetical protein
MAHIERINEKLLAVELTEAEAGLLIAHLAVALGRTVLPQQQKGATYSVDSPEGQRVVFGLRRSV